MKDIIIKIKGMHCKSCEMLIKDALEEQEGIDKAELSHEKGEANITFDETLVTEEKLKSIIKEEGFEV